ncbi:MAG TPA: helix-turn-helix domain-containing protein [Candidatus Angelobacter sp.]|nr:helix-turn-helix domain-containing protein [Candidatus Angelobacter sp.]
MPNPLKQIKVFNEKQWISKSEAARLRGVSRQAIWELVQRGRLVPAVYGHRMYLRRSDVLNLTRRKPGRNRVPAGELIGTFRNSRLDPAKWLSMTETSHTLGVTHQVVSALIRRGRLRALSSNGKTLVLRSTVEKFKTERPAPDPGFFPKRQQKYDRKTKYLL